MVTVVFARKRFISSFIFEMLQNPYAYIIGDSDVQYSFAWVSSDIDVIL
ncbi:hypothetical protein SAMN05192573_12514 [Mucilaginibacter gossypii]|uniref:Uncharacterized protein n=1 Tax=Mucilaginibacter gossypii TaxID=551996 RepID=A0A1G8LYZ0_9SPHI|nr:hypothetical protein SAMN05192573_12514 [Mucilaginibacter gossypii]